MSLAAMLDHRVHIRRDADTGPDDDYGHPVTVAEIGETFAAAIQPKGAREVAALSQAGTPIGDFTLYLLPRRLTTADAIVHDSSGCPKPDAQDLPDCRFEITGIRNAAGRGHHLEADVRMIGVTAGVEGS